MARAPSSGVACSTPNGLTVPYDRWIILDGGSGIMSIELSPSDRHYLERFLARKARPTRRQRAKALLLLAEGHAPSFVSQIVGIAQDEVIALEGQYAARGFAALAPSSAKSTGTVREGS